MGNTLIFICIKKKYDESFLKHIYLDRVYMNPLFHLSVTLLVCIDKENNSLYGGSSEIPIPILIAGSYFFLKKI